MPSGANVSQVMDMDYSNALAVQYIPSSTVATTADYLLMPIDPLYLNLEQCHAYDIILQHLNLTFAG